MAVVRMVPTVRDPAASRDLSKCPQTLRPRLSPGIATLLFRFGLVVVLLLLCVGLRSVLVVVSI